MLLHQLSIQTDKSVINIKSEDFRKFILAVSKDSIYYKKISFHLTKDEFNNKNISKIPYILYGFPKSKSFYIYAYNNDIIVLEDIIKHLHLFFYFNSQKYKIIDIKLQSIDVIPISYEKNISYKTISPILLFTNNRRKWLDGVIINESKNNLDNVLKEKIQTLIIQNVRYQMQQLFSDKSYKNFDNILVEWLEFKLIKLTIKNKLEYGVVGKFNSNYKLPKFIGHKIGFGYGEIVSC